MKLRAMRFTLLILLCTLVSHAAEFPDASWKDTTPSEAGMNETLLRQARDYALTAAGSGMIVRGGKAVMRWGDQAALYDVKSSSKSIGVTLLGVALLDGKVKLDDPAIRFQPELGATPASNVGTGWLPQITLRHLANQTSGFEKPGGYGKLLFPPGTRWHYSDAGPNWLAECLTLVWQRDLDEVMRERVFTPLGIAREDMVWRTHAYRPKDIAGVKRREFGSGFSANVSAMARLGLLYLRGGVWRGKRILPAEFVKAVGQPAPELRGLNEEFDANHGNASEHYSLLWWNNGDGTMPGVPRDAFWSAGLHDSHIVVVPSLDLVIARAGPTRSWKRYDGGEHYDPLRPFFEPIIAACRGAEAGKPQQVTAPYPPSTVIRGIEFAPVSSVLRSAKGSDNWPMTWADDDALYTAYGDGNGFEPFTEKKLSMGLAKVTGGPADFKGSNLRSATGEFRGDGKSGRKASGILMVDGVLYLLARNISNSQLAWSHDHGKTWTWADWTFKPGFGCPGFVNFGKNYEGARDGFIYLHSTDGDSAYEGADLMVMARVPKAQIKDRAAYEFFTGVGTDGTPQWSKDIAKRGAVFSNPGGCYRGGISYNAALKRYLWVQVLPQSKHPQGPRFQGGFGIYDAPEPWGPWTTVFFTQDWDIGPGESSGLPTKWMSADGQTMHLVFSGDDHFSVRRVELKMK